MYDPDIHRLLCFSDIPEDDPDFDPELVVDDDDSDVETKLDELESLEDYDDEDDEEDL